MTETIFFLLLSPIMWFGHTLFLARLAARARPSAGARRRATTMRCRGATHRAASGRRRCSAGRIVGVLVLTVPAAIPYALFIAGGPAAVDPARGRHGAGPRVGRALPRIGLGRCRRRRRRRPRCAALALPAIEACAGDRARADACATWRTRARHHAVAAHLLRRPRRDAPRWTRSTGNS